jgi:hypothetical protein
MEIRANGGVRQFGWLIWEQPGLLLVAEHHCVVRRFADVLVDTTPQDGNPKRILFVPDHEPAEIKELPNRFFPIAKHELVLMAIECRAENARLFASGHFDVDRYRQNDALGALYLDRYVELMAERKSGASLRAKRKAERQRRKRGR